MKGANLNRVSTTVLQSLHAAIGGRAVKTPIAHSGLVGFGIHHQQDELLAALAGHSREACLAILEVALAERDTRKPSPELVWTGPEAPLGTARDTAVVLRSLFEGARESVLLAGYSFTKAKQLLAPLHHAMTAHTIDARFFVHVEQIGAQQPVAGYLEKQLESFLAEAWPFGEPRPRLYYDKRALVPGPPYSSLHAKCVVVNGTKAFVSSANFSQRAQEQNIEVGVLIEEPSFAGFLAGQWLRLIDAGIVAEYVPGAAPSAG